MSSETPKTIRLQDYKPPNFLIDNIDLRFDLGEDTATVTSNMNVRRNLSRSNDSTEPLILDGDAIKLVSLSVGGFDASQLNYHITDSTQQATGTLRIDNVPQSGEPFNVNIVTELRPQDNTKLYGLYRSKGTFCTQCEAEGFRRITYFLDRPDVMSRYRTTIVADRDQYPVLLSNGNLEDSGSIEDNRHYAVWNDPFPKPSYLFALVAGQLECVTDQFKCADGRSVNLHIYTQEGNSDRCSHAMDSLKRAMKWDEEQYGRVYDLDRFNIVAIDDFNMGAMENKSLNVFNSRFVLANDKTATDSIFKSVEAVIGHEYFHNWTGNRVTCRDWFQLSLKEGLTVFREREFSADMNSRGVNRIEEANLIRNQQFPEDLGPTAHPVRPSSYMEINNFYTATVYEKGAEVIRMIRTLIGSEAFRRGTDLYFERHDGCAVTCDELVQAMEDASGRDLTQFRLWYSQAGTPKVTVHEEYDPATQEYTLIMEQKIDPTPEQPEKEPMHIPIAMGLLDRHGNDIPLRMKGSASPETDSTTTVLELRESTQRFTFKDVPNHPVPSILRDFSAPVKVSMPSRTDNHLQHLMVFDRDAFSRWDAIQEYVFHVTKQLIDDLRNRRRLEVSEEFFSAFERLVTDESAAPALRAKAMALPSEGSIADQMSDPDPLEIHTVRSFLIKSLGQRFSSLFLRIHAYYTEMLIEAPDGRVKHDGETMGLRAFKNTALEYLVASEESKSRLLALRQMRSASNMEDEFSALKALAGTTQGEERDIALDKFYEKWKDNYLVVLQWLSVQASAPRIDVLDRVQKLIQHEAFSIENPNCCMALLYRFALNPIAFHGPDDGSTYRFLTDQILRIDGINSQISARIVSAMKRWYQYPARASMMKAELERINATDDISIDVYEIVSKSLKFS